MRAGADVGMRHVLFFFFEQLGVGALRKLRTLRIGSGGTGFSVSDFNNHGHFGGNVPPIMRYG